MSVIKWSIVLPVLLLIVTACHKRPPAIASPTSQPAAITAAPAPPPAPRSTPSVATPAATPLTEAQLFERMTLDQLNASKPLDDVFFDYDENLLREDARQVLQRDAQWLAKWPQTKVRIYGHCDERGTTEYNIALGDRRAVSVRDYLTSLGRLSELNGVPVLPGHGPALSDCAEAASFYLEHRQARLEQVRAARAAGATTAAEVVEQVYADVDRSLWPAAEWSVRAQLTYLDRESSAGQPRLDRP